MTMADKVKNTRAIKHAKKQRQLLLWRAVWTMAGVIALAAVGYVVWDAVRPKPGQSLPLQSRTHIRLGDEHEPYNSDPPTSGAHAGAVSEGFYSEPLPDENLVHNLEHGYIVISYNCARLAGDECQRLETQIRNVIDNGGEKLIAVPRPTLDTQIALTSWGRLYKLESFDQAKIVEFIKDFRNKAPEPEAP